MAEKRGGRRSTDVDGSNYVRDGNLDNRNSARTYQDNARRTGWLSLLIAFLILALAVFLVWWFFARNNVADVTQETESEFRSEVKVEGLKKTYPEHGVTVPAAPANVVIATQGLNLNESSSVEIKQGEKDYGEDKALLEAEDRILRRDMDESAGDGIYTVYYRLCGEGKDCLAGSWQFKIDKNLDREYQDRTRDRAVYIEIDDGRFNPEKIVVSQGTRLTWENREDASYRLYPGNQEVKDYFPNLTSGPIRQNSTFTFVLTEQGYLEYFAENGNRITGKIIVR